MSVTALTYNTIVAQYNTYAINESVLILQTLSNNAICPCANLFSD